MSINKKKVRYEETGVFDGFPGLGQLPPKAQSFLILPVTILFMVVVGALAWFLGDLLDYLHNIGP